MKVSIIMCAYNSAQYIEQAIESIINQTYTNWELIISDDCSPSDNTIELVKKYLHDERIKLFQQEENKGYLENKNWALKQATGDLITQLDSDDISKIDRIEKQVQAFIDNPDLKICGTNFELIDMDGNFIEAKEYEKDEMLNTLELEYPFWYPSLMCKPELFKEFGYFHDYFDDIYGDDHYWTLVVINKYPIYFIKDVGYSYRINPNSLTNVFDSPRKMFSQDIIAELYRQIKETGTDWLQKGQRRKLRNFEMALHSNKKLKAERYRVWAAKSIDTKQFDQAKTLLKKHFEYNNKDLKGYRTLLYYLKKKYLS